MAFKALSRPVAQFNLEPYIARKTLSQSKAHFGDNSGEWQQLWDLPRFFDSTVDMDSKAKLNSDCDISDIDASQLLIKSNATMVKCHHEKDLLLSAKEEICGGLTEKTPLPIDNEKVGKQPRSLQVKAVRLDHTVPTVGFVIEESPLPGNINMEACVAQGLQPGPNYQKLKSGQDVTSPSGRLIRASEVVGPGRRGRKIVVMGDTRASNFMLRHARGADVIVHEATVHHRKGGSRNRRLPNSSANEDYATSAKRAWKTGHSTPSMAGAFARAAEARRLILTHFSARYDTGFFSPEPIYVEWVDSESSCRCYEEKKYSNKHGEAKVRRGIKPTLYRIPVKARKRLRQNEDFSTKEIVSDARKAFNSNSVMAARDFMVLKIPRGGFDE